MGRKMFLHCRCVKKGGKSSRDGKNVFSEIHGTFYSSVIYYQRKLIVDGVPGHFVVIDSAMTNNNTGKVDTVHFSDIDVGLIADSLQKTVKV